MKKVLFSSIVGFALIAFSGCTSSSDAEVASKCQAGKCDSAKKVSKKCAAKGKCSGNMSKKVASKCASGKCGGK